MTDAGRTGYCSERCLLWDVLGVPALKEDDFIDEILTNQRRAAAPEGWAPPRPYPALEEYPAWREARPLLVRAAALSSSASTDDR